MATKKKETQLKKMEQRKKALEVTNPEMAKKLEGKIAAFKGKKDNF